MTVPPAQLAVPKLYDDVVARFAAEGIDVPQFFGWNASAQQSLADARIVWIPGDPGGNLGRVGPAKYPSQDQLRTLFELVTIQILASDVTNITDERRQYTAARLLHDALIRAVHLAAVGTYQITLDTWMAGDTARRFGAGIQLVIEVQAPITDQPAGESILMDAAMIEAATLDHTETTLVERDQGG